MADGKTLTSRERTKMLLGTWIGVGVKYGGFLGFLGNESTQGVIGCAYDLSYRANFSLTNFRAGIGLGGGGNMVALCVFNCPTIWNINGNSNNDWGVNVSLGSKWSSVAKALSKYEFFPTLLRIGKSLNLKSGVDLDNLRNSLTLLYTSSGLVGSTKTPKVVSIDIPMAGYGLELSANYSFGGKIQIS